jgi:hypothetical protein
MMRRALIPFLIVIVVLTLAVSSGSAAPAASSPLLVSEPGLVPGNYCASCHLAEDPRLSFATQWKGGIAAEMNTPCPAAKRVHEELYYTERLLLMIDRAQGSVGTLPEKTRLRLEGYTQQYSRMLDIPISSLDAFVSEAQSTRYQLSKIYSGLNDGAEDAKKRTVLAYAAFATLVVLGSLIWGLYNTGRFKTSTGKQKAFFRRGVFVLCVLAFFALPLFRVPAAEVVTATQQQQDEQGVLDSADRAAAAHDRAMARAWMLARLGASWNDINPALAASMLDDAISGVRQAEANNNGMWGQSLAVQEAMIGVPIDMEKAGLIAVDLNAARARLWSVPLIAAEWNKVDPLQAAGPLQAEQEKLASQAGVYRDLQMRGIALAWTEIEPSQSMPTAQEIADPSVRAWTLREIAVLTNQASIFPLAAEAARAIEDPVQRARSLRELAVASKDKSLFDEALAALDGVCGMPLAYALGDLAAASGNGDLLEGIGPEFPDAITYALLRLGEYQAAWDISSRITDPFDQARAQAAITGAWGNPELALQIKVSFYRDLALRDIIRKNGDKALSDSIGSVYYRMQALTALGEYGSAAQLSGGLADSFPLVELSLGLMHQDPQAALRLVDGMSRAADKATVLAAAAAATNDEALFEQALGMALAARVRGDALAPAQASLDLAEVLWTVSPANAQLALRQARGAAQKISTK